MLMMPNFISNAHGGFFLFIKSVNSHENSNLLDQRWQPRKFAAKIFYFTCSKALLHSFKSYSFENGKIAKETIDWLRNVKKQLNSVHITQSILDEKRKYCNFHFTSNEAVNFDLMDEH